jgi:hypothetical protein
MTTTQAAANGATTAAKKGFGSLPCPKCGQDTNIKMYLDDLHTFACPECDDEFTADDVRQFLAKWSRVLSWLDSAPAAE